ncbi:MAG TPA: prepilin-type N-terminal cleavage/methylation domain-containing protein [Desulfobulbus sp.]|nr:prepilin-type N-terminal cleavage/methylation domain-containing protein [Desulfobulbus sp.]
MIRELLEGHRSLARTSLQGFTLMEIMLATIILGMVVSMVTMSLSGSLRVVEATRDQGELYYRAQIALQRISEDLESALLIDGVDFIADASAEADKKQVLVRFTSMAHVAFDPEGDQDGMGNIGYALIPDPENEGQLVLLRSDQLVLPQQKKPDEKFRDGFLLCDRLRSITFTYFDSEGEAFDSWDTRVDPQADAEEKLLKRRLPAAVSCRLEFWLDQNEETTLIFQTSVKIPTGMIIAKKVQGNAA